MMTLKRYFYWIAVVIIVGFLSTFWLYVQSNADDPDPKPGNQVFLPFLTTDGNPTNTNNVTSQVILVPQATSAGGRIDAFTFYIPYAATAMAVQFDIGSSDPNITSNLAISTTISIAVNKAGSIIYYDQWEDALEADLTVPTQSSTLIWGDGDPTNNNTSLAAGVQVQGIPANDILTAGTVITLRNTVPVVGRGNPPALYFDGGDTLTSKGGAIAVSTSFWTVPPGPGILYTDAWELYPTNRWGKDYIIPIGQGLPRGTAQVPPRGQFDVVGLNVQAVENGTLVNVDLNNDGTPELTNVLLNQGEQLSVTSGVLPGARVKATGLVQVQLFASDPDSRWEARGYTEVPVEQWTNDYLAPRASDGDFWLYNPTTSTITITVQSMTNTTAITIPAQNTRRYPVGNPPFTDANMSGATGLHFTSNGPAFYGLVALDSADIQDSGYDLSPTANLTTQTLVGWGVGNVDSPGCNSGTGRESRVYVTALTATTIYVDRNNDGTPDDVDVTGDGVLDPSPYALAPLQELSINDPRDCDMTGAFLYTTDGTPFAAVWAQDASADARLPSIDAGTNIVPLRSLALQKTFSLLTDVDCSGSISLGDDVRFELQYSNDSATDLTKVTVADTLPTALSYITNTTTQNGSSVPDDSISSPYPLDGTGLDTGPLDFFSAGLLTYDATVNDASTIIVNRASANSPSLPLQGDAVTVFVPTGSITPLLQITQTLIDPVSGPIINGQVITFNLSITNTGTTTITTLPVGETFNASDLTFRDAIPAPNVTATGVITWDDLTNTFGDLPPNTSVNLTISFIVNQPPGSNSTNLSAIVRNAQRQNSPVPLTCSSNANLILGAPTPTSTPTSTSTPTPTTPTPTPTSTPTSPPCDDCQGNGKKEKTPTPTPITVAVFPTASPNVLPPVTFLPETGIREARAGYGKPGIILLMSVLIGTLGSGWLFWRGRFKRKNE